MRTNTNLSKTTVALAVAAFAIAPAALATPRDGRSPDTRDAALTAQQHLAAPADGRSPDTRDAALAAQQPSSNALLTTPVDRRSPDTIDAALKTAPVTAHPLARLSVERLRNRCRRRVQRHADPRTVDQIASGPPEPQAAKPGRNRLNHLLWRPNDRGTEGAHRAPSNLHPNPANVQGGRASNGWIRHLLASTDLEGEAKRNRDDQSAKGRQNQTHDSRLNAERSVGPGRRAF